MQDQSQSALIAALKKRDPAALAALFEQFSDKIYRLAVGLLHDEVQADGVVQNTFLALIDHIDSFEGRASIETWLYRVAHNECLMRIRQAKPIADLVEPDEPDTMPSSFIDWQSIPEDIVSSGEAMAQMEQAIASLSPTLRAVFTLRDIEELSTAETAEILGINEATVKVRLHRARLALRERLASYFEERVRA